MRYFGYKSANIGNKNARPQFQLMC